MNKNLQTIFLCLLFYGLSISIFLKEINLILLKNFDLNVIFLYRVLVFVFSIYIFFYIKKKIDLYLSLYLLIFFLFLYNSYYGQEFNFIVNPSFFYPSINVNYDNADTFFQNKNKILIICFFNVILPLSIFAISKSFKINLKKFKHASLIICNLFLYLFFIFVFYKFIIIKAGIIELNEAFINLHSMIYILNIYFVLIIDELKNESDHFNFKFFLNIGLIFLCFILTDAYLHLIICLLTGLIFFNYNSLYKKYIILSLILFLCLFFISYLIISSFEMEKYIPGGLANSVYVRIMNIYYFLFYSDKLNIFIGNNFFIDEIYTYPHNIFVDIFICTGFTGLLIFVFVFIKFFKKLKFILNKDNIFIFIILFQSFIFSNLSGFLFTNIIFNMSLAACLCLFRENESLINKNS